MCWRFQAREEQEVAVYFSHFLFEAPLVSLLLPLPVLLSLTPAHNTDICANMYTATCTIVVHNFPYNRFSNSFIDD